MNLKLGLTRLALALSVVAGSIGAILCFLLLFFFWNLERDTYISHKNTEANMERFWHVWDTNGWTNGNKAVFTYLRNNSVAQFEFGDETIYLNTEDVFPNIELIAKRLTLREEISNRNNEAWSYDLLLEEKASDAKKLAMRRIREKTEKYKRWGSIIPLEFAGLSILASTFTGIISFIIAWFICFVPRWIILGFTNENHAETSPLKIKIKKKEKLGFKTRALIDFVCITFGAGTAITVFHYKFGDMDFTGWKLHALCVLSGFVGFLTMYCLTSLIIHLVRQPYYSSSNNAAQQSDKPTQGPFQRRAGIDPLYRE